MSETNQPIARILSEEDAIELALMPTSVRMRLSDKVLDEVRGEIHNDPDLQGTGLGARFARFITGNVEKLVSHSIEVPLADITSVEYTDGRLAFTYRKKPTPSFENVTIGIHGKQMPALAAFPPDAARAFAEKVREAKAHA